MTIKFAVFAGILAVLGVRSAAQSPDPSAVARFKAGVDLVPLEVCIRDRDGRLLPALRPEEFVILDDGVPQSIQFFEASDRVPLAVALLIDRSASMTGPKLDRAKAAAESFMRELRRDDLVEVIAFNELADRAYPLGTDRAAAAASVAAISADGQTGLFEAIVIALQDLQRVPQQPTFDYRRVILVLSDGQDTSSLLSYEDALDDVRRSGVLVYVVSLRTNLRGEWIAAPFELAQIAFDSGGQATAIRDLAELNAIYREIATELHHLYRLAYVPGASARDGRWRAISVRIAGQKDARVRTRSGYFAPRP